MESPTFQNRTPLDVPQPRASRLVGVPAAAPTTQLQPQAPAEVLPDLQQRKMDQLDKCPSCASQMSDVECPYCNKECRWCSSSQPNVVSSSNEHSQQHHESKFELAK